MVNMHREMNLRKKYLKEFKKWLFKVDFQKNRHFRMVSDVIALRLTG